MDKVGARGSVGEFRCGGKGSPFLLADQPEVAGIDDDAGGLPHDANDVLAPDEVSEERQAAEEREPPEGDGDDGLPLAFGDEPLHQHAAEEGALPGETDGDPQEASPTGDIEQLEHWVDEALEGLEALTSFVLPGGGELAARLHLARTVCRRAERSLVRSARQSPRSPIALHFLNRLSDLLFAWSRAAAHEDGQTELLWSPKPKETGAT